MSLYAKLLKLQKAVVGLAKDKSGNSYQYVSGDKVLSIVRPTMDDLGLLLIPEVEDATYTRQDYNLYDKNGNPKPKSEIFCSIKLKFTWVDSETGEQLVCSWASSGQNNWDKGLGSALTYGERYFLLKFFHVATDRDDVDAPKTAEQEMNDMNWESYINSLNTVEELDAMWAQYGNQLRGNKTVVAAFNKRKKAVLNGTNA
jgi:hypothetical protein